MSAPRTATANYDTFYKLTLATSPAAVGTSNITGGADGTFYAAGGGLTLWAATPVTDRRPPPGDHERAPHRHRQLRHLLQADPGHQPGGRGHEQHHGRRRRHLLRRRRRADPVGGHPGHRPPPPAR